MPIAAPSRSARFGSWLTHRHANLCERLANRETAQLQAALRDIRIDRPVFIAGLARSGSTILLEALASCERFASARYGDYPPIWFPHWWSQLRQHLPIPASTPSERAHGDGIRVTLDSPEAFDEVFWMHFFPQRHDPALSQRLDSETKNPRFDAFYRNHIRKVLLTRGRPRYLCKGNYNLARLPYLHGEFGDAKFVVPIRHPLTHIASLQQQHQRFADAAGRHPSIAAQMARSGHFEFGPQRRAENLGDNEVSQRIQDAFAAGRDIEGYALQWAQSYGWLADCLSHDTTLAASTLLLRHEEVCQSPKESLRALANHVELTDDEAATLVERWSPRLRTSNTPRQRDMTEQLETIQRLCEPVARRFGYAFGSSSDYAAASDSP